MNQFTKNILFFLIITCSSTIVMGQNFTEEEIQSLAKQVEILENTDFLEAVYLCPLLPTSVGLSITALAQVLFNIDLLSITIDIDSLNEINNLDEKITAFKRELIKLKKQVAKLTPEEDKDTLKLRIKFLNLKITKLEKSYKKAENK